MAERQENALIPGALYLRQSMDRTGEGLAVARQEPPCRTLASQRGIAIVETFTDNDISAAGSRRRPDFERLMKLISTGAVQAVIAWDLDRLTRNWTDTVRLIEAGMKHDLMICLVQGGDMDMASPNGRLMAGVRASVARHEIEIKSARQKAANKQAAESGRRVGGRRPFGFGPEGIIPIPREAAALREGYEALLTGGSLAEIARQWNEAGFTSGQAGWKGERKGKPSPWRHDSVRAVLRNPRYAGLRAHNGTITGRAEWPPIVPETTWRQAQAILDDPTRRTSYRGGPNLLTGIALCGICDAGIHRGGSYRGYPTYRCGATLGHVVRKAAPCEEYISALAIEWFARPDASARLARTEPADTSRLLLDRTTLERRLESAAAEFADDPDVTPAELRMISRRINAQIAEIDTQLASAQRSSVLVPLIGHPRLRDMWDNHMTLSQQRTVISAIMAPRLLPVGRGVRRFQASSIDPGWKL